MTPEEKLLALIQQDKREADHAAKTPPVVATTPVIPPPAQPSSEPSKPPLTENVAISAEKKLKLAEPKAEDRGQRTVDSVPKAEILKSEIQDVKLPPVQSPKPDLQRQPAVSGVEVAASPVPNSPPLSPVPVVMSSPGFRSGGGSGILLLNRVLGVVVLVLVAIVFYSVASIRPGIADALERQVSGAGSMSVASSVVSGEAGLGVDAYLDKVGTRNIFVPKTMEKNGVSSKVEPAGAPKDLKLVAVSMESLSPADSMAIIKSKSDSKTYFVKLGQTVGDTDYVLDRVLSDRIVLKQGKQEYELK